MGDPETIDGLEEARGVIRQQQKTIKELLGRLDRLGRRIVDLKKQLEDAKRAGERQAAPFSKGPPKAEAKTPGRKVEHMAAHRAAPTQVAQILQSKLQGRCVCGGRIIKESQQVQYQSDVQLPIPVIVTKFEVEIGRCESCAKRHQGRHPRQTSDALGSARVQIGPNIMALATRLKHKQGMAFGGFAAFLKQVTNKLTISRAAFARADLRIAPKLQPCNEAMIKRLRLSVVTYMDETGWRIGGIPAWLWVFTHNDVVVYAIERSRGHEVIQEILGQHYKGVRKSDCFNAYDSAALDGSEKSKCLGHIVRCCGDIEADKRGQTKRFSHRVLVLMRAALRLKERAGKMSDAFCCAYRGWLESTLDRAKHAIRPGVIVGKTNGCNRSNTGAWTHAVTANVLQNWKRQSVNFLLLLA